MAVVLAGRALLLPVLGVPMPAAADEFGYLLTADTFAHGRLINLTSPVWPSFETFHVFHIPVYQSQFPIAYPLLMAVMQKLVGIPWLAVYFVTALLAGTVTWMLQGWLPPKWALWGGLLVAVRMGLFSYWMNSYWGGSLTALGGCLVLGAVPRILPGEGRRNAGNSRHLTLYFLAGALGLAILANTRPFDGAAFALPILLWMAVSLVRSNGIRLRRVLIAALPGLLLFSAIEVFVAYYQYRVTGSPWQMPYAKTAEYGVTQPFIFQKLKPIPEYRHWEFYLFYVVAEPDFRQLQWYGIHNNIPAYLDTLVIRADLYWHFFVAPLMTLPLFFALPAIRKRKFRLPWTVMGVVAISLLAESYLQVHYLAALTGVIVLLLMCGVRQIAALRIGRLPAAGKLFTLALPWVAVIMVILRLAFFNEKYVQLHEIHAPPQQLTWAFSSYRNYHREEFDAWLKDQPGKHLVIVHTQRRFWNYLYDLVNNGADLENARVLWARNMDTVSNCRLAQHYAGRNLWLVDDGSEELKDWRESLNPRLVSEQELCTFTWVLDRTSLRESWVPVNSIRLPVISTERQKPEKTR